jgi:hypothetical protein
MITISFIISLSFNLLQSTNDHAQAKVLVKSTQNQLLEPGIPCFQRLVQIQREPTAQIKLNHQKESQERSSHRPFKNKTTFAGCKQYKYPHDTALVTGDV